MVEYRGAFKRAAARDRVVAGLIAAGAARLSLELPGVRSESGSMAP